MPRSAPDTVRGVALLSPIQCLADSAATTARIETALRSSVAVEDPFLTEVASHLIVAGGKRLRPAFVVAAATVADDDPVISDDLVMAAVSVELVHLGSLYHDDVMDESDRRRTVETVNHRWTNLTAILAGDFLLARASEIAASLGTEVAGLLAATIARLCEGQVAELQRIYDTTRTESQYLTAVEGKTAALYSTSCRIGALVAGHDRDLVDALTEFGRLYGVAFQIVDDILDLVATDAELGKPAGNDLVEGVYTLPVIRHLAAEPQGPVADLLGEVIDAEGRDKVREILAADPAIDSAVDTAARYCERAAHCVADLDASPTVTGLRAAAANLLDSLPR